MTEVGSGKCNFSVSFREGGTVFTTKEHYHSYFLLGLPSGGPAAGPQATQSAAMAASIASGENGSLRDPLSPREFSLFSQIRG